MIFVVNWEALERAAFDGQRLILVLCLAVFVVGQWQ